MTPCSLIEGYSVFLGKLCICIQDGPEVTGKILLTALVTLPDGTVLHIQLKTCLFTEQDQWFVLGAVCHYSL